jgi:hypothetical protein
MEVRDPPVSRRRRVAFVVLSILFAMGAFGGLFGVGLIIGWFDTDQGKIHRVHDIGFGVLSGVILTVAFVAQIRDPEGKVSPRHQIVAAALASLIAGLIAEDLGTGLFFFLVPLVALAILIAINPTTAESMRRREGFSPLLAGLAALGAVPLTWFALTMARFQREGPATDPHVKEGHWTIMATMALALVLVALLSSLKFRGWRISAWCAGAGAFVYGLASVVFAKFPGTNTAYAGSKGVGWGVVAMAGGVLFIGAAEWEARRTAPAQPGSAI